MTSFIFNLDFLSKYSHILRCWESGLQHTNLGEGGIISSYRWEVLSSRVDSRDRTRSRGLPRTDHKPSEGRANPRRPHSWHPIPALQFPVLALQVLKTFLGASTVTSDTT